MSVNGSFLEEVRLLLEREFCTPRLISAYSLLGLFKRLCQEKSGVGWEMNLLGELYFSLHCEFGAKMNEWLM